MATKKGTIRYKLYQNNNETSANYKKWYARAQHTDIVEFDELVSHISSHGSPFSEGTISGVLKDMLNCVKELLLDSKKVRLGDLGLLYIGLDTKGADTAKDWTPSKYIEGVHLNVMNTKEWSNKELASLADFAEAEKYAGGE